MSSDDEEMRFDVFNNFYQTLPSEYKKALNRIENLHDGTQDDFIGMMKAFMCGMDYYREKIMKAS